MKIIKRSFNKRIAYSFNFITIIFNYDNWWISWWIGKKPFFVGGIGWLKFNFDIVGKFRITFGIPKK